MEVLPGQRVRIIVETDHGRGDALVMDSVVYEAAGDTLVLAQTTPPLASGTCGGEITVTYLVEEKDGPARYGFPAEVAACIEDYRPARARTRRRSSSGGQPTLPCAA